MGNLRPTSFSPGLPQAVTPPPVLPPPTPSVDPVMSALAQMMNKLNEVSTDSTESNGLKPNVPMPLPSKGRVSELNL